MRYRKRRASGALMQFANLAALLFFALAVLQASPKPSAKSSPKAAGPQSLNLQPPPGTILPIRLNGALSSATARAGQRVTGRLMQAVPLPSGDHIREGATVSGQIVSVAPAGNNTGGLLTLRFDTLLVGRHHQEEIPITTELRALAGYVEIQQAQVPETGPDRATSDNWGTRRQIGGHIRYGYGGVLVHLRANPEGGCEGPVSGENDLQAMWVFSADACGVYGADQIEIAHSGRDNPQGAITLAVKAGNVRLQYGDGMLLRVLSSGPQRSTKNEQPSQPSAAKPPQ